MRGRRHGTETYLSRPRRVEFHLCPHDLTLLEFENLVVWDVGQVRHR